MNKNLSVREIAIDFLQRVVAGQIDDAFTKYIGPDFRHHNPYFKGDAESLKAAMEEDAVKNPNKILEIQQAIEEGELVAVHSRLRQNPKDAGWATVHIFRFQDKFICELWDIVQENPKNSPNEYGMF